MSLSVQCDANPRAKVHRGGSHMAKWVQHVCRDLDDRNGQPRKHANKGIDRARTLRNETYVYDDEQGGHVPAESVQQVVDSINAHVDKHGGRTPSGKKAVGLNDQSVIMRPLILGLDPEWFEQHNPDWKENGLNQEAERLHEAMIGWAAERWGAENLRVISLHMDEATPQLQIGLVPLSDTGQISQKWAFPSPAAMKQMHQSLRHCLREEGYDASLENVTGGRSTTPFTDRNFKREMRKVDAAQERVDQREAALVAQEEALVDREQKVKDGEAELRRGRRKLGEGVAEVQRQEKALAEQETALTAARQQLDAAIQAAERYRKAAEEMVRELRDGSRRLSRQAAPRVDLAARILQEVREEARREREAVEEGPELGG